MHTQTMHMYVYHKMFTCNERYFLTFLECNNHETHGPTDYHAYATISNTQRQFLWTYVMYVLASATDSFNIHTSLVWLDPSLSLCIFVNGNSNGNYHVRMHAIQHMNRVGPSLASFLGYFFAGEEKTAWYTLFAHAQIIP